MGFDPVAGLEVDWAKPGSAEARRLCEAEPLCLRARTEAGPGCWAEPHQTPPRHVPTLACRVGSPGARRTAAARGQGRLQLEQRGPGSWRRRQWQRGPGPQRGLSQPRGPRGRQRRWSCGSVSSGAPLGGGPAPHVRPGFPPPQAFLLTRRRRAGGRGVGAGPGVGAGIPLGSTEEPQEFAGRRTRASVLCAPALPTSTVVVAHRFDSRNGSRLWSFCVKHCARSISAIVNPHYDPKRQLLLLTPFWRKGHLH